ncbi:MAG TPA: PEP-CTERM sorting domain-containing protein [Aquabacterium sp.]|uniref:PEP-CTERM sorting domain-containing protein n=1 Tax=Aquabacterium sp. TaxID=1872578 RepID=UPI002E3718EF|nr:PEP-CTERM sorting domain-containing protein [Aquabacterium sp.]HEX5371100.1 PEP-CTERM sorting domain-containing protein [Aquabacterium sp.]
MAFFRARPFTLIGGTVLALSSLSAQAAIDIDMRYENLQLTVTDTAGNVAYPWLQATGDAQWAPLQYMLYQAPEDSSDTFLSNPLPVDDIPAVLSVSTPRANFEASVALNNDALTLVQHIDTEPYTEGLVGHAFSHMDTGISPQIFSPGILPEGVDPNTVPVFGGIALAPGSQATLTGTMSFTSTLTFADGLTDLSVYDAHASIDMFSVLLQIPEGLTMDDIMFVDAANSQLTNLNWTGELNGAQGHTDPVTGGDSISFTMTVTNTSDVRTWLVVGSGSNINLNHNFYAAAGAVPEPSTWALMGLGLVGISAVARRRQRARV